MKQLQSFLRKKKGQSMRMLQSLVLLLLCIGGALHADAQNATVRLQGSIQDAFLERGLSDCVVTLMRADSTSVECKPEVLQIGNDSQHFTTIYFINVPRQPGEYLIRVQKEGYGDGWMNVTIPESSKEGNIIVPMIDMRKSVSKTIGLKEVEVKATRIKVKMRGDTLVYDASAFQMPEGSMLSHLIEQLPGARMTDDGEIFINGRKIDELTLNSKSLFRGNKKVLLENLPYFTVKELKVFERQSLYAAMRGIKDENPEYVMDVNLKDEYSVSVIANAEAAGGTHERYQTRAFGLLLTKTLTVGAFGNVNNISDISRAISQGWHEGQGLILGNQNKPSTRKAAGMNLDYQSAKKTSWGFPAISENLEIIFDSYDNLDESGTYQERFLPTGTAFARNMRTSRDRMTAVQVFNRFNYLPWLYESSLLMHYWETDNSMLGNLQQWDSLRTTATQRTEGLGKTKEYGIGWLHARFQTFKNVDGGLRAFWTRTERDAFNRQHSMAGEAENDYFRHEYGNTHTTEYSFEPSLKYDRRLWKQLHIYLTERYKVSGNNSNDRLYMLNDLAGWGLADSTAINLLPSNFDLLRSVYDTENSTYSRLKQQENEFTVELKWGKTERFPVDIRLSLPVYAQHERFDYVRGDIDTLARHNLFTLNPSLYLTHNVWSLLVDMASSTPGLMNLMPYRDARNALNIVEGNPWLKNNRRIGARMVWRPKWANRHTGMTASRLESRYIYHLRSVAQGFTYDEQTSAYTYRPENVEGNWSWNTSFNATFSLCKNQKWWIDSSTGCDVWHSVDYASVSGMADAQLNKVETVNTNENLKLSYKEKYTKVSLLGDVLWRRTWGHRSTFSNISAFDFRYGVNAMQVIPTWNTTFNVDAMMLSRRGYGSDAMNKDELVVNASVTQPILHGKVKLTLESHDLLHQLSNTTYEVNAQGRTETWYRVIPNYVMLRVAWQF
ncbi:MAG: outer membrane beta-barrel family protein, partial [Bacteroidaceae bacterium]|nr:outer membrane beta-barrel family protein [Bacteroidaceae bacterium]